MHCAISVCQKNGTLNIRYLEAKNLSPFLKTKVDASDGRHQMGVVMRYQHNRSAIPYFIDL